MGKARPLRSICRSEEGKPLVVTRSSILSKFPTLRHGISTRTGGVSPEPYGLNLSFSVGDRKENVEENRKRFYGAIGVDENRMASPRQQHTSVVRVATQPGKYDECDALITNVPGICLSVSIADCAPVFLFDPKKKAIGCVHSGWRGTQKQIVPTAIDRMASEFGSSPSDMHVFAGPCAGSCCYEVGDDVVQLFSARHLTKRNGKTYLDIGSAIAAQLRTSGIPDGQVESVDECTICGVEHYHSYRRDRDRSGRMAAVIEMIY